MPGHIEYQHSEAIPPEEIQEHGPFTIFSVRRHKNYEIVNQAEQQARKDWEYHIGDGIARDFKGVENPVTGTWDSLIMPECRPELLFPVAWITQTFFFVDGQYYVYDGRF
ncbi:uncharacterized protein N7484_007407 [Penicillium longicatenatum]|uniref:uncharacterized protein n=1 Tax=Penicillium longicatenatum TaxID=1561947 RepID=UPI0025476FA2|nr:uncharacterized protein N7484_007407 [Penicillium longicatenatum]KAJ5639545.1 hypothetical protein N7484_007407 [Penicillium longicatenatum]